MQERLPADLVAATEEEVVAIGGGESARTFRPDVQVRDPWPGSSSDDGRLAEEATAPAPIHVFMDDEVERWIEIRDDVLLDLQPLIDQCHERGRYQRLDYRRDPDPPLAPDDARWVDDRLRGHGLR